VDFAEMIVQRDHWNVPVNNDQEP